MFIEENESLIRLCVFVGIFTLMAIIEAVAPKKKRSLSRSKRWPGNIALVVINTIALRIAIPVMAVEMASIASSAGWGLLSLVRLPLWLEIVVAITLLDFFIYAQHVASHKLPILWRLHKVHHVDRDIDVTTGARFHPIEVVLSMAYKILCVLIIGPVATAVVLFEVFLNASAMFNHANWRLPARADQLLRKAVITPDVHRVHHSTIPTETDSNYGFFLSCWDRIFGTYTAQPKAGHGDMSIGIKEYQSEQPASLLWSLALPFVSTAPRQTTTEGESP